MSIVRHVLRGCGTLPDYGSHPGGGVLVAFVLMGAAAGARSGWRGALFGALAMLVVFGPLYLYGAYDRSRSQEARAALRTPAKEQTPTTGDDA